MKQSASETWKRTSNEMKTNLSTFVGAGVCEERCWLLFAASRVTIGAVGTDVTDLTTLVAASSVDDRCLGVTVMDVDRGRSGVLDVGVTGGLDGGRFVLVGVADGVRKGLGEGPGVDLEVGAHEWLGEVASVGGDVALETGDAIGELKVGLDILNEYFGEGIEVSEEASYNVSAFQLGKQDRKSTRLNSSHM